MHPTILLVYAIFGALGKAVRPLRTTPIAVNFAVKQQAMKSFGAER